jgi:hypothetical protein
MNIIKLLFIGMPVDKFVHTNVKLFCVYYFFMNSSRLYVYSGGSGSSGSHSSNLHQWF